MGTSYNRLLTQGTVRIEIPLPANVEIVGEPGKRTAVLFRGTPSTNNVAFENALMLDGRLLDLQSQAVDAVISHYQPRALPTVQQQAEVRAFQQTLFSNERLRHYFKTGIPPQLPKGRDAPPRSSRFRACGELRTPRRTSTTILPRRSKLYCASTGSSSI